MTIRIVPNRIAPVPLRAGRLSRDRRSANGKEAIELARQDEVDVLLLDISMPDQGGIDALAAIKARRPDLPVLILSGFPEAPTPPRCCGRGPAAT